MRWTPGTRSGNVEDRRSAGGGGGLGGLPIGRGGGIGGILIMLVLAVLGGGKVLGGGGDGGPAFDVDGGIGLPGAEQGNGRAVDGAPDPDAKLADFIAFVLDDVQTEFAREFREAGKEYDDARLVMFTRAVNTGCGQASSDTGPFYCQLDSTVYVDLGFFQELSRRFQAPGDFAQAYVIAHEVGHHVQNQVGIASRVRELSEENPDDTNELSVRQELQADCFAGVWAHSTYERGLLEEGDLEEGLTAASAVGDDRIQKEATGRVNEETWTHGSSAQRQKWFGRGFDSGDPDQCDTFDADKV
jgi:predicted metalloprotease